jgi:hypothetical protein
MEINKKNRTELKSYFLANKIPTQQDFEEFIDANLNQQEDGIAKVQGSPIALQAEGDSGGTQEVLNLFTSFSEDNPSWSIDLNPRVDPSVPASNKPGLNFKDAIGASQLFIKSAGGDIGIGTIEPASRLSIQAKADASLISVVSETTGNANIFEVSQENSNGVLSIRSGDGTRVSKLSGATDKPSFFLSKVGVGTDAPLVDLHVSGEAAELRVTNTKSGRSPHLTIQSSNGKSWDISSDEQNGDLLSIAPAGSGEKGMTISRDGKLSALGGLNFGERADHLNQDGSMYRLGGKLYLAIDDDFFIRDSNGSEKFRINTNNGRMAIGGTNSEAPLSISGSGRDGAPNASMHISSDVILFGGNNAGGSAYSGKILVDEEALKIVGKTSGTNASTRKVEISAEGGMTVNGRIAIPSYLAVSFSAVINSNSLSGSRNPQTFGHENYDLGNDFNGTHFTAPVKGVYMFAMTISKASSPSGFCYWTLRLNGSDYVNGKSGDEVQERSVLRSQTNSNSISRVVMTQLEAGDTVHVQQTGSSRPDNHASSFEGTLIQALV